MQQRMTEMETDYVEDRIFKLASGTLLKMLISLLGNCARFRGKRPKADGMFPKSVGIDAANPRFRSNFLARLAFARPKDNLFHVLSIYAQFEYQYNNHFGKFDFFPLNSTLKIYFHFSEGSHILPTLIYLVFTTDSSGAASPFDFYRRL